RSSGEVPKRIFPLRIVTAPAMRTRSAWSRAEPSRIPKAGSATHLVSSNPFTRRANSEGGTEARNDSGPPSVRQSDARWDVFVEAAAVDLHGFERAQVGLIPLEGGLIA